MRQSINTSLVKIKSLRIYRHKICLLQQTFFFLCELQVISLTISSFTSSIEIMLYVVLNCFLCVYFLYKALPLNLILRRCTRRHVFYFLVSLAMSFQSFFQFYITITLLTFIGTLLKVPLCHDKASLRAILAIHLLVHDLLCFPITPILHSNAFKTVLNVRKSSNTLPVFHSALTCLQ